MIYPRLLLLVVVLVSGCDKTVQDPIDRVEHRLETKPQEKKPPTKEELIRRDSQELQGAWAARIETTANGSKFLDPKLPTNELVIEAGKMDFSRTLVERAWQYTLDPSAEPARIDLVLLNQGDAAIAQGIYELRGGRLKMGLPRYKGGARPQGFDFVDESEVITYIRPISDKPSKPGNSILDIFSVQVPVVNFPR